MKRLLIYNVMDVMSKKIRAMLIFSRLNGVISSETSFYFQCDSRYIYEDKTTLNFNGLNCVIQEDRILRVSHMLRLEFQ
jgi:hypothetical protein